MRWLCLRRSNCAELRTAAILNSHRAPRRAPSDEARRGPRRNPVSDDFGIHRELVTASGSPMEFRHCLVRLPPMRAETAGHRTRGRPSRTGRPLPRALREAPGPNPRTRWRDTRGYPSVPSRAPRLRSPKRSPWRHTATPGRTPSRSSESAANFL